MSTEFPSAPERAYRLPDPSTEPAVVWQQPPPRRKFQQRYGLHLVLFLLTVATTTCAGAGMTDPAIVAAVAQHAGLLQNAMRALLGGLTYSLPILLILGAHEFGHYGFCRLHNVDATLPYFLPAPILMTGTVGAVIRIREPFPSKRALFDIGVAGPIAGFLVLLPFLYWGITLSKLVPANSGGPGVIYFGEPLLYKAMAWLHFGRIPDGLDVSLHPMAFAAWWGMLATALNLLPFGQLDGGHIVYSIVGRRSIVLSIITLVATAVLAYWSVSWVVMTLMMAVMGVTMSFRHPPVPDQQAPLDPSRKLIAVFALIIFVICFTPTPIKGFLGQ